MLVVLVAKIILVTHFVNLCWDWVNKKAPLLKRLEQLEIELESSNMKVADMQSKMNIREIEEKISKANEVEKLEEELTVCRNEMQCILEQARLSDEKFRYAEFELSQKTQEYVSLEEDNNNCLGMINNLNMNRNDQEVKTKVFEESLEKLTKELEDFNYKNNEYEKINSKSNIEIKDLSLQLTAIENDVKNVMLENESIIQQKYESNELKTELDDRIDLLVSYENEWNGLTDLLNEQIEKTSVDVQKLNQQLPTLRSTLSSFESRCADMVDKEEILRESLDILKDDVEKYTEADGWEINDVSLIIDKTESILQLKQELERASSEKESIEYELSCFEKKIEDLKSAASLSDLIIADLEKKKVCEETLCTEAQCKMEVFTELFNKKEAELQKQLGQQVALFDEINEDSAGSLEKVSLELEEANDQLRLTREKLKKCGTEFKAKVSEKEAAAHANWIDAKREEKRLKDLEEEYKILSSSLMAHASIEPSGRSNLPHLPGMSSQIPPPPGTHAMLPPLPGMPSIPSVPRALPLLPSMPSLPSDLPQLIGMPSTLPSLPNISGYLPSLPGMPMPSSANNLLSLITPSKQSGMPPATLSTGLSDTSFINQAAPEQNSYPRHFI